MFLPEDVDAEPADVFIANILAGPLSDLAPTFAKAAKPGAPFAISGILEGQEDELLQRYAEWFDELRVDTQRRLGAHQRPTRTDALVPRAQDARERPTESLRG